jgi:hypothetical protein
MKEGQGGQGTGPPHPGRLSHCYRCDNITLHSDTFAHAPKALTKSSRPRSGVSHSMGLSVRGRSSYAPEQRSVRGLRHHVECPQMADAVIEAQKWATILHDKPAFIRFKRDSQKSLLAHPL